MMEFLSFATCLYTGLSALIDSHYFDECHVALFILKNANLRLVSFYRFPDA